MSDLLQRIRSAQIRAGEQAVCEHLREMESGLLARAQAGRYSVSVAISNTLASQQMAIDRLEADRDAAIAAAVQSAREACAAQLTARADSFKAEWPLAVQVLREEAAKLGAQTG